MSEIILSDISDHTASPQLQHNEYSSRVAPNDEEQKQESDVYAYLDRPEFTSEKFKIEIRGLPKFYGISEFRKLLKDKLNLSSNKIKPPNPGCRWCYVCFHSDTERDLALEKLNGYTWKNCVLSARPAEAAPDPLVKRRIEVGLQINQRKKQKVEDSRTFEEIMKDKITPLWAVSYEQQAAQKQLAMRQLLVRLGVELLRANPMLKGWLEMQRAKWDGLPCQMLDIRTLLPHQRDGYRNKCEFTIGKNDVTGEKTVGFRLGSYAEGTTGVGPIDFLVNVPQRMKDTVKVFESYIRKCQTLEVFDPETHTGHWRQLTTRLGTRTDQLMLIVGFHPQDLTEQQLANVKSDLKHFFSEGDGKQANVTSLYFKIMRKKKSGETLPDSELVYGASHIMEQLCGLQMKISPEAFFQVNTAGAEVLYQTAGSLIGLDSQTTLLDVCCGSGSIGLSLAKDCGEVLGLELVEEAVRDARANVKLNSITNCQFFAGKAEEILSSVVSKAANSNVVAIVDPPRAGFHQKAIVLLRRTLRLERMVFLSCDPNAAMKNMVELGRAASKTLAGDPFLPVSAVAVDMFPHTTHCELIVYFERSQPVVAQDV